MLRHEEDRETQQHRKHIDDLSESESQRKIKGGSKQSRHVFRELRCCVIEGDEIVIDNPQPVGERQ